MKPTEADFFRILAFEDTHYRDLNGCTILGFCGNKIFILDPHYDEQYASDSEEYTQCKEIVTSLKKSFISYIKDAGRLSSIESNINMQKERQIPKFSAWI